ncbi:class I SAM-dependent methyltransferase [Helicobacter pullorum]
MLSKGFKEVLDFALEQVDINPKKNILDFGCGNGRFVEEMRERNLNAYGCDIVPKIRGKLFLVRQGLEHNKNSQYIRYYYDLEKIPFEDDFFAFIFSYQVFEHIRNLEFSTKEMHRVMGGGGVVYSEFAASYPFVDCHTGFPMLWLAQKIKNKKVKKIYCYLSIKMGFVTREEVCKAWRFAKKYLFYRSYKEMDSVFRANGFEVRDITYYRRKKRLMLDGVGTIRELLSYKILRKKGKSDRMGYGVRVYLYFHVLFYRLLVNRVVLLSKLG